MKQENNAGQYFAGFNTDFKRSKYSTFIVFLKFFKAFLFKWKTKQCFAYTLYTHNKTIFLANTAIHRMEMKQFTHQAYSDHNKLSLIPLSINWILRKKISILLSSFTINPFRFFTVFLNRFYYEVTLFQLNMLQEQEEFSNVCCFELGYIGQAVSDFCIEATKKSIYIQHGLQDKLLYPIFFNEYVVWSEADYLFFKELASKDQFKFRFPIYDNSLEKKRNHKKIAMIAIDFPTKLLSEERMLQIISEIESKITKMGWKFIVRPHPRHQISSLPLSFQVDSYQDLPIEESFIKNQAELFICFNSAAVVKIQSLGYTCAYFSNPNNQRLYTPLTHYALELSNSDDLTKLIEQL